MISSGSNPFAYRKGKTGAANRRWKKGKQEGSCETRKKKNLGASFAEGGTAFSNEGWGKKDPPQRTSIEISSMGEKERFEQWSVLGASKLDSTMLRMEAE